MPKRPFINIGEKIVPSELLGIPRPRTALVLEKAKSLATPVGKLLDSEAIRVLTPRAAKLTKEDLVKLNTVSPKSMGLDAKDVSSIRVAFARDYLDNMEALANADPAALDVSCCCCTPCCCAAAEMDAVRELD